MEFICFPIFFIFSCNKYANIFLKSFRKLFPLNYKMLIMVKLKWRKVKTFVLGNSIFTSIIKLQTPFPNQNSGMTGNDFTGIILVQFNNYFYKKMQKPVYQINRLL